MSATGRRLVPHAVRAVLVAVVAVTGCVQLDVARPGPVVEVRVSPDTLVLRVGDSARLRASPIDASAAAHTQDLIAWSSATPGVAVVDPAGWVHALAAGSAMVTATAEGVQGHSLALVTGQPATLAAAGGNGQSAAVNAAVATAPSVLVTDAGGNPVSGVTVDFVVATGGGSLSPAGPVVTGLNGVATAGAWTLGPLPGANTLTATASGTGIAGSPVTFTATGTVGPPHAGMSSIVAAPGAILPSTGLSVSTITVTVRDSAGSTVAGATVTLAATGTGNMLTQPAGPTNAQGQATGSLSSDVAETKTVTATVNGTVMVTQTATVTVSAAAPANLAVSRQVAGAVSNADFLTQPTVDIVDGFGNRVPAATDPVTVSLVSGNGTLVSQSGSFTVTAVNGRATFAGLRIRGTRTGGDTLGTGPHVLQFSSPGFNAVKTDTIQVGVSLAYNLTDVYTRNGCLGCHGFTHANVVNQPATLGPCTTTRIVPGDTTASLIYQKVRTASPPCGGVMPTTGQMSPLQIRLIRDWILQGAPNN